MKKILFLLLFCSISTTLFGQENIDRYTKTNHIFYGEAALGFGSIYNSDESAGALNVSFGFNYQHEKSLYTIRYNHLADLTIGFVFIFPVEIRSVRINEFAALYGRRWLFDGSSISLSGGLSLNHYKSNIAGRQVFENIHEIGLPLEFNIRFFKKKKRRYRAYYGLIPVGKPTAFGRGVGLKLSGNIAKRGFISFGLTYSLGTHKYY